LRRPADGARRHRWRLVDGPRIGPVRERFDGGDRRRPRRAVLRPTRGAPARRCLAPDTGLRDVGLRSYRANAADGGHRHRVREPVQARVRLLLPPHETARHRVPSRIAFLRRAHRIREPDPIDLRGLAVSTGASTPARRGPRRRCAAIRKRQSVSGVHPRRPAADAGARVSIGIAVAVLQIAIVGLGAPLLVGTLRTLKARLVGRRGPSPWQPYADLRKLLAKEAVVSTTTSWVFRATPYALVAT